jgi:molybdopterin molybdotransferase
VIPLEEARAHVLDRVAALPPVTVALAEGRGLRLAEAVVAAADVPPFANTAMDGYAVRAADTVGATDTTPVRLPVVGEVAAGHPAERALSAGEAMRIFTGAPMPDGADAVVVVEATERLDGGSAVAVHAQVAPGLHVRPAGDDLRAGDAVFHPGEVLAPSHLGVLANVGAAEVVAVPRPRVGVLSTGDELVEPGRPLGPGQIHDANRPMLLALVAEAGFVPVDLGRVADDDGAIAGAVTGAAGSCDAVLTSGGVSMGDLDLVKVVLDRLGEMRWMQVAIRPAKPFAFGLVGERPLPVFGLPGNPVSSLVSFELLARPALRRMAGHPDDALLRTPLSAVAGEAFARRADGKTHFARVRLRRGDDGVLVATGAGAQGSHQLTAVARAHGLAVLPDGAGPAAGEPVEVLPLGP